MPFLTDRLDRWAADRTDATAFLFLERGEREGDRLTFAGLRQRSLAVAAELGKRGLHGRPVLLLYPPGVDFISALFGCLYAGAIAVPAPYLFPGRKAERIAAIAANAECAAVLTAAALSAAPDLATIAGIGSADWICTDRLAEVDHPISPDVSDPDDIAFLQYTSGSTAEPRGVMVTHANLEANLAMIAEAFDLRADSSLVSWLPVYHDMGLIGGVLQPVNNGRPAVMMSPLAFLQKPVRWLRAISHYRATTSGAPSFAYGLCARVVAPEQLAGIDLSSWTVAFCGAEPIRAADLDAFAAATAASGFDPSSLFPCYGLAETTLLVAGGPAGGGARRRKVGTRTLTASGVLASDQTVAIVDPETRMAVTPGAIGEVWVSGRHVGRGYWNRPALTEETFGATIAGGAGRRYLRTGDLGATVEGDLVIAGRLKDVIIVRGVKHHPEEIEETVLAADKDLRGGTACVISAEADEAVVVLLELPRGVDGRAGSEAIRNAISAAVIQRHGVRPDAILIVARGALPRTTSGKLQRRRATDLYADGALRKPAASEPNEVSA